MGLAESVTEPSGGEMKCENGEGQVVCFVHDNDNLGSYYGVVAMEEQWARLKM